MPSAQQQEQPTTKNVYTIARENLLIKHKLLISLSNIGYLLVSNAAIGYSHTLAQLASEKKDVIEVLSDNNLFIKKCVYLTD